jgi:hypothetical protein
VCAGITERSAFSRNFIIVLIIRFLHIVLLYNLPPYHCSGIWDPHPQYTVGQSQAPPRPFVHNSRWLQSPGTTVLQNETLLAEQVRPYIQAVVQRFGKDERVLMLDLMDQPDNPNLKSYGAVGDRVPACQEAFGTELVPLDKAALIQRVLPQLLTWVDQALAPDERLVPITLADWYGGVVIPELGATIQEELRQSYLAASDILTFHHYSTPDDLLQTLAVLQTQYPGRPVVLSSFMARDDGSTFDPILGLLYARNVWAMNWGLVSGSIQTIYNSDSWNIPYTAPPDVWHHDVLWPNGTVYDEAEREYISSFRQIQDASNGSGDAGSPDSWAGAQWAATGLTVVSVLGIVGLVVTCAWYTLRRQRSRARARTISAVLEAAEQAEMVEMKGLT